MKIKFLRNVDTKQNYRYYLCNDDVCGCYEIRKGRVTFFKDDEFDPNVLEEEIDLSELVYNVDYSITQYP